MSRRNARGMQEVVNNTQNISHLKQKQDLRRGVVEAVIILCRFLNEFSWNL